MRFECVIGRVKYHYLKCENACDQYVGRHISGLNQLSKDFATSPPYFDYFHVEIKTQAINRKKVISN